MLAGVGRVWFAVGGYWIWVVCVGDGVEIVIVVLVDVVSGFMWVGSFVCIWSVDVDGAASSVTEVRLVWILYGPVAEDVWYGWWYPGDGYHR